MLLWTPCCLHCMTAGGIITQGAQQREPLLEILQGCQVQVFFFVLDGSGRAWITLGGKLERGGQSWNPGQQEIRGGGGGSKHGLSSLRKDCVRQHRARD